ncbi:GNAT family N-acetyltransferase [Paenibacillus kobensis]|uniref:GNAT family N-acetyltransferase n=1 Tax=Paenibacillus kobensis TaxID=59841 RepID=UPI000FD8874F|nr:GNAT family protein [Paenibacillus kobensis]
MPHLIGENIILREYRQEDLSCMREWCNNSAITYYLSDAFLYPHMRNGTEAYLNALLDGSSEQKGFVIADRLTEQYIGQIDLFELDWKNRSAEFGMVIGNALLHGRGIGTEAVRLLQQFVFMELNLNRLQLEVYEYNKKAIRCYTKCGFREEGRLRERHFSQGRYCDVVIMAILREAYVERQLTHK